MNDERQRQQNGSVLSVAVWRLAALALSPMAAAIGCYFAVIGRVERIEIRSEYTKSEIANVETDIRTNRNSISTHANRGPNGLPHPQGVLAELDSLSQEIKRLTSKIEELERKR